MRPVCGLQRKIRKERFIGILLGVEETDQFIGIKLVRVNTVRAFYNFSVGSER
jgi:hypothetical protein